MHGVGVDYLYIVCYKGSQKVGMGGLANLNTCGEKGGWVMEVTEIKITVKLKVPSKRGNL